MCGLEITAVCIMVQICIHITWQYQLQATLYNTSCMSQIMMVEIDLLP